MNSSKYYLTLDINKSLPSQYIINMTKGDSCCKLIVSLVDNGNQYKITEECTAVFRAVKPLGYYTVPQDEEALEWVENKYYANSDGVYSLTASAPSDWSTNYQDYYIYTQPIIFNSCEITGNSIVYDVTTKTIDMPGDVECEITLSNEFGKQITSPRFTIHVEDSLYDDSEVEGSSEYSALTAAVSRYVEAVQLGEGVLEGVQDAIAKKHEHDNLTLLDWLSSPSYPDPYQTYLLINGRAVGFQGLANMSPGGAITLYPNKHVIINSLQPISSLAINPIVSNAVMDGRACEYSVEFVTGSSPGPEDFEFPPDIQWVDELTIGANKHYQISILNNIALWCAVDVEAEEAEP